LEFSRLKLKPLERIKREEIMAEPFLAEIRIMSFSFPPKGWATCDGQLLPINQNQALFSLLGTTYGGDGRVNFGLPDLRGRVPFHDGGGRVLGERAGETAHTLTIAEMAVHNHSVACSAQSGTLALATKPTAPAQHNTWAISTQNPYKGASDGSSLVATSITNTGGSQPHENMQPYLVLNFCIALQGIFPSQN
jgi:microcystin-dependent protein